jgi:hypothetical protein
MDMETMKSLADYHTPARCPRSSTSIPRLLCASIDQHIAILCARYLDGFALRLHAIGRVPPRWEKRSSRPVLLSALSPDGEKLITVSGSEDPIGGEGWELRVRGALDGKILNYFPFIRRGNPPSNIAFTSGIQFYTEDRWVASVLPLDESCYEDDWKDHHVQTTSTTPTTSDCPPLYPRKLGVVQKTTTSKGPEDRHTRPHIRNPVTQRLDDEMSISATSSESRPCTGVRRNERCIRETFSLKTVDSHLEIEEVSKEEILLAPPAHPYALDDNLEWVLDAKSRRVCWLPPGYVSGIENGHFFVGSSIVTAGRDGIVRKLTFRKPGSDS